MARKPSRPPSHHAPQLVPVAEPDNAGRPTPAYVTQSTGAALNVLKEVTLAFADEFNDRFLAGATTLTEGERLDRLVMVVNGFLGNAVFLADGPIDGVRAGSQRGKDQN